MGPKSPPSTTDHDLFRLEMINMIGRRHELVRLAELIDWSVFERKSGAQFASTTGRPALPTGLVSGLLYLKHTFALSDEDVVARWVENPYWQHSCGERYAQHELPCEPSISVCWRQRIGEAGVEWLLTQTIEAAKSSSDEARELLDDRA
jgi:IS5 family transposase